MYNIKDMILLFVKLNEKLFFYFKALSFGINLSLALFVFKFYFKGKTKSKLTTMGSSNGSYCGENIYSLFKYLVEKNANVIYIIDKNSTDKNKVKDLGVVLNRFSFKGILMVLRSEIMIYDTSYIDLIRCHKKYIDHIKKINVCHGIRGLKKVSKENAKKRVAYGDYIIATSEYELEIKKEWGYPTDRIYLTGLPRYDVLLNKKEKIKTENRIFYMPTWRPWFKKSFMNPSEEDLGNFKSSNYFKKIIEIANSQELNNLLKEKNYILEIYVHKLMHRYLEKMKVENNFSNIKFLDKDANVQDQIVKSKIMITDYSSVFFDFLYLGKPVILYQFDKKRYYKNVPGSYIADTEIESLLVYNFESLLANIRDKIDSENNNIHIQVKDLVNKYIKFHDKDNCKRVYNSLYEILNKNNSGLPHE